MMWDTLNLYAIYDGQLTATPTPAVGGTLASGSVTTKIGRYSAPYWIANGLIDDVRLYNNAFSANEIAQIYNEGKHTKLRHCTIK